MSHAFYRTAQGRLPRPMSSKAMTASSHLNNFRIKGKTTFFFTSKNYPVYVKIINMISQKSQSSHPHAGGGVV